MAGFAIGALPYFLQYQQQAQQQAIQKQQADMQLAAFQQQQAQMRDQQAAQAAAGNAYPRLAVPPQAQQAPQFPPQQTPAPGQPSQPMVQPGQVPPGSLGPGESQVNLSPLPPGGVRGAMPPPGTPPLPPFKPMPTSPPPQQAAQPASITPPPATQAPAPQQQGGLWSIQDVIKAGQDQGLEGKALFDYMQIMQPVMDTQAKMQANQLQQQFNRDFKVAQLNSTQKYHEDMLKSHDLDRTQRAHHEDALLGVQQQRLGLEAQRLGIERQRLAAQGGTGTPAPADTTPEGKLPPPQAGGGLSAATVDTLATAWQNGDHSVTTGLSKPAKAAVMNRVGQREAAAGTHGEGVTDASIEYAADRRGAQAAATREANTAAAAHAINRPGGAADQLLDAGAKVFDTGSPYLNKHVRDFQNNVKGDPRISDLNQTLLAFRNEYGKAVGGSSVISDAARRETDEAFNNAQTLDQLKTAVNRAKKEMATALSAAQDARKDFTRAGRKAAEKATEAAPAAGGLPAGWTVTEH